MEEEDLLTEVVSEGGLKSVRVAKCVNSFGLA